MNQQEFIHYVTRTLDRGTRELDVATSAKLSALRHTAVSRGETGTRTGLGVLTWVQQPAWISLLLACALVFAAWSYNRQLESTISVETEMLLLTGELPPTIYADQSFAPWLNAYRR